MINSAVICEFNPFHNGHKFLLDSIKKDGSDCTVAVMSSGFTQRGDVAVYSKFDRTKQAIAGGADVVIELPCVWAVSSAQRFAKGGCDIIRSLGCIDRVYFGSECGDIELLRKSLEATVCEEVNALVRKLMGEGEYYPNAQTKAVRAVCGDEIADILCNPNNTLGIEYMRCLVGSGIELRTIKREGVCHDSDTTNDSFASASKLREMILQGENIDSFVPFSTQDFTNPAFMEYGERAVLCKLRSMSCEELEKIADVTEGLENRILAASAENNTTEEILKSVKTKRYTHARLRRILTCALLSITKEHQSWDVPYVRVLGFNSRGEEFVRNLKTTCNLPVIINAGASYKTLEGKAKEIFDIEIKSTDIRTVFEKSPTPCGADFRHPVVRL